MSGPGRLNFAALARRSAVPDQRDEHDVLGPACLANVSSALAISSCVGRAGDALVALRRLVDEIDQRARRHAETLDASASVVPHLWNGLPCSGSPGETDDDQRGRPSASTPVPRRGGSPIRRRPGRSASRMIGMSHSSRSSTTVTPRPL